MCKHLFQLCLAAALTLTTENKPLPLWYVCEAFCSLCEQLIKTEAYLRPKDEMCCTVFTTIFFFFSILCTPLPPEIFVCASANMFVTGGNVAVQNYSSIASQLLNYVKVCCVFENNCLCTVGISLYPWVPVPTFYTASSCVNNCLVMDSYDSLVVAQGGQLSQHALIFDTTTN